MIVETVLEDCHLNFCILVIEEEKWNSFAKEVRTAVAEHGIEEIVIKNSRQNHEYANTYRILHIITFSKFIQENYFHGIDIAETGYETHLKYENANTKQADNILKLATSEAIKHNSPALFQAEIVFKIPKEGNKYQYTTTNNTRAPHNYLILLFVLNLVT